MSRLKPLDVKRVLELATTWLAANADLTNAIDVLRRQPIETNLQTALSLARIAMTTAIYLNNEMIQTQPQKPKQPSPPKQSSDLDFILIRTPPVPINRLASDDSSARSLSSKLQYTSTNSYKALVKENDDWWKEAAKKITKRPT